MSLTRFVSHAAIFAALTITLAGCWGDPLSCEGEDAEECEAARHFLFLATLPRFVGTGGTSGGGGSGGGAGDGAATTATTDCAKTAAEAVALSYVRIATVPVGSSCYFRYEIEYEPGNTGPFKPDFRLVAESGNADLYVGFDNDASGGTVGYDGCSTTTSGGGWVRCSRNTGNADEIVSTNATGIPAMGPGAYRIVSVFNAGGSPVDFAILAYRNDDH